MTRVEMKPPGAARMEDSNRSPRKLTPRDAASEPRTGRKHRSPGSCRDEGGKTGRKASRTLFQGTCFKAQRERWEANEDSPVREP